MARCSDYCVIYDISDDSERRKVDIILKGYGFRIQKSVFECRMRKRDYNNLVSELEKLCIETGFVKIYTICYNSKNSIIGKKDEKNIDNGYTYIV
jgi:CRISPR-associated protein Cas2